MTVVTLADVAEINPRGDRPRPDEDVAFVGMAGLSAMTGTAGPGVIRPFGEVSRGYTIFRDRDLLVAKITPCFENGKTGQAHLSRPIGVGSTEFHVVRPKADRLDPRFALHFLRQDWIRRSGELWMTGSAGQRRVPAAFLEALELPLPPIEEQRRIAAILDHADEIQRLATQRVKGLQHLLDSVFNSIDRSHGQSVAIGEVATVVRGASPRPAGDPRYFGGSIPWLKISDVTAAPGRFVRDVKEGVTEEGRARSVLIPAGTLILTNSATVGIPKVMAVDTCIHDGFLAFTRLDDRVDQTYLYAALLASRQALIELAPHGTQKNLNTTLVKGFRITLPTILAQRRFAETYELIERRVGHAEEFRRQLRELILSVQARAFSGRL